LAVIGGGLTFSNESGVNKLGAGITAILGGVVALLGSRTKILPKIILKYLHID